MDITSIIKEYYEQLFAHKFDQWKGMENIEIDTWWYSKLVFIKGAKAIKWRKNTFSTHVAGAERIECLYAKIKIKNKREEYKHRPYALNKN